MLCYITVLIHVEVECSYKNSRKVGLLLLGQKSTHFIAISYGSIWLKASFQVAYNDVCTREVASQMMVLDLPSKCEFLGNLFLRSSLQIVYGGMILG